jgi:hypothetical protein
VVSSDAAKSASLMCSSSTALHARSTKSYPHNTATQPTPKPHSAHTLTAFTQLQAAPYMASLELLECAGCGLLKVRHQHHQDVPLRYEAAFLWRVNTTHNKLDN